MIVSNTAHREFQEDLLREPFETKCFLAKDTGTTPEALDVLSRDSFWWVRDSVADNKNTSIETLKRLSKDVDFRVQDSVAHNLVWKRYLEEHSVDVLIGKANQKVRGNGEQECKQSDREIGK